MSDRHQGQLPTTFVHGFRADDWLACWNMHLAGTLTSTDFLAQVDPAFKAVETVSVRDLPIDTLRDGRFTMQLVPSHRLSTVMLASIIRSGGQVGFGVPPYQTQWANREERDQILQQADREILYEKRRRRIVPDSASRLACIWLADDTPQGRNLVWRIKGSDAFVLQVRILTAKRLTRLDARWLEKDITDETICGYWSGEPRYEAPLWEYLVEGVIACTDGDELERLRNWVQSSPPQFGPFVP